MNMETCPNLDEIPKDLDLVVTVSKRIKLLFVRHHFLNHKTDEDVSLERLLKFSILTPSVQHMILKRIVEPRNEIVENPLRGAFSEEERSLFIACSKAVFSYLHEKQKLYEKSPKKSKKGGRARSTYQRTADNKTQSSSEISDESSEKESDKLDYSIVAKLADPRLLGQKNAHLKLIEEIVGKCFMQEMYYDFMMYTFNLGKCYIIAMSIIRVFSFGLYNLFPCLLTEIFATVAGLFIFDCFYKINFLETILKTKRQIIKELDKSGFI